MLLLRESRDDWYSGKLLSYGFHSVLVTNVIGRVS